MSQAKWRSTGKILTVKAFNSMGPWEIVYDDKMKRATTVAMLRRMGVYGGKELNTINRLFVRGRYYFAERIPVLSAKQLREKEYSDSCARYYLDKELLAMSFFGNIIGGDN